MFGCEHNNIMEEIRIIMRSFLMELKDVILYSVADFIDWRKKSDTGLDKIVNLSLRTL